MTSINFNASATTALRTLQQTNTALETTQNRVATGLKIGEAKDNAAYWAISTTLKSDNKSLATVKDALSLGAATVDTAYQGLNKAKDVLDEIKSKLTAATQDGVDREVIQKEISELQNQLKSIAASSSFSGENWLSIDSAATGFSASKTVVSSFSRDATGAATIGTIGVDISNVALFDANVDDAKNGIIDAKVALSSGGRDLAFGGSVSASATGNTSAAGLIEGVDKGLSAAALASVGAVSSKATASYAGLSIPGGGVSFAGNTNGDGIEFTINQIAMDPATGAQVPTLITVAVTGADLVAAGGNATLDNVNELVAGFNYANSQLATPGTLEAYSDNGTFAVRNTQPGTLFGVQLTAAPTAIGGGGSALSMTAATTVRLGAGNAQITSTGLNLDHFADVANVGDKMQLSFKFDGGNVSSFDIVPGATLTTLVAALNGDIGFAGKAIASEVNGELVVTGKAVGADKTIALTGVTYTDSLGASKELDTATGLPYSEKATVSAGTFTGPISLDADDKIQFDIAVDGGASKLVTINKATIDAVLSINTGTIADAGEYASVLNKALTNAGVTGVAASVGTIGADAGKVIFTSATRGQTGSIAISDVNATKAAQQISVDTIDISSAKLTSLGVDTGDRIRQAITAYVSVVNDAIGKLTTAASNLGAVSSRIDMQTSFVDTLIDTIDKGVSGLIDADLSEESTRLQALQTKQQLGIQALSIANSSQQNVLRLFQ
jgi:flagellin-like hook-associated protein FlgL